MSKATATPPAADATGTGPAAGDGAPLTPGEVVARGMADGGRRIRRYTVDFESGEVSITYYPPEGETERADLKARILAKLKASPYAMTRKQLALAMGRQNAKGRFSQVVSALVETGEILEEDGELTDDASKFSDDTYS